MKGEKTRAEIFSQPDVWLKAIELLEQQADNLRTLYQTGQYQQIIFTGCGSTYYLSLAAATLTQELTHQPVWGIPASEIWLNPEVTLIPDRRTLLVCVSRSGETTETLRAASAFATHGQGTLVTLTCQRDNPLSQMGALNLVFTEAQEESIAQTRAFSTLYLATTALAALWGGRENALGEMVALTDTARLLLINYSDLAKQLGQDDTLDRFYFLGSGPRYGLACELNLKMKEMALTFSEPFHFMEFRHGPMSMVTSSTLLVGLLSERHRQYEQSVLTEMRARGARTLVMAENEADVVFQNGISESLKNVLYLPVGQLMAFERALHKSLDPDHPHNLDAVVRL